MSVAKKVLVGLIALYVLILFSGFFLPEKTVVSRSVIVQANQESVFKLVSEHQEFNKWSPWAAYDSDMSINFDGPAVGVGSKQIWKSQHPKVGNGESVYTGYEKYHYVSTDLKFEQGGGQSSFFIKPKGEGATELTWEFESKHAHIFERFIGFFLLDSVLGPEFESGLASLRLLAERT